MQRSTVVAAAASFALALAGCSAPTPEQRFVERVRAAGEAPASAGYSDAELVAVGRGVCAALDLGASPQAVLTPPSGGGAGGHPVTPAVLAAATQHLCPAHALLADRATRRAASPSGGPPAEGVAQATTAPAARPPRESAPDCPAVRAGVTTSYTMVSRGLPDGDGRETWPLVTARNDTPWYLSVSLDGIGSASGPDADDPWLHVTWADRMTLTPGQSRTETVGGVDGAVLHVPAHGSVTELTLSASATPPFSDLRAFTGPCVLEVPRR